MGCGDWKQSTVSRKKRQGRLDGGQDLPSKMVRRYSGPGGKNKAIRRNA